jgi:hypothetical protein
MRLVYALAGLSLLTAACASEPGALPDPPQLQVTSPARSLVRDHAGLIEVTGQVSPNPAGDRISKVTVNGVDAQVASDGTFLASVELAPGATFLHTVARDVAGGEATDTRTVQAGTLKSAKDLVDHGLFVALSDDSLAAISTAAGALMKSTDFAPILAPLNPMVSKGAAGGEDCLWGKVYVNDVDMSSAKISLVPKAGGLAFQAEITGLVVPARARYAALCIDGSTDLRMTATRIAMTGTLVVTPKAGAGFDVVIASPNVTVEGFDLTATGLPGAVLSLLDLSHAIGGVIATTAKTFMTPLVNRALGGLAGPKQVMVAGKTINFEVAPEAVLFDVTGAKVALDSRMTLAGGDARFVYTPNDPLVLDPGNGFALGISDDAANQLLASVTDAGLLSFSMPAAGGTFDSATITATLPPMITADTTSGQLRLLAGDLMMTFQSQGVDVAHVALNLSTEVAATPSATGVTLHVQKPEVFADVLDNISGYADADKEAMIKLVVDRDVELFSLLLGNIPLPTIAGVKLSGTQVGAGDGFVKITGELH